MSPAANTSLGLVALRSGETAILAPSPAAENALVEATEATPSGVIYTDRSGPSLEQLLADHEVITAVLERPVPMEVPVPAEPPEFLVALLSNILHHHPDLTPVRGGTWRADEPLAESLAVRSYGPVLPSTRSRLALSAAATERDSWAIRLVALSAISGAISAVGWFLLIASVVSGQLRANPYVALTLALGGLALTATVAVTRQSPPSE
jgi:hypothetical protein